jgi:hypothetical protein
MLILIVRVLTLSLLFLLVPAITSKHHFTVVHLCGLACLRYWFLGYRGLHSNSSPSTVHHYLFTITITIIRHQAAPGFTTSMASQPLPYLRRVSCASGSEQLSP